MLLPAGTVSPLHMNLPVRNVPPSVHICSRASRFMCLRTLPLVLSLWKWLCCAHCAVSAVETTGAQALHFKPGCPEARANAAAYS